jgi:hypothetical protein
MSNSIWARVVEPEASIRPTVVSEYEPPSIVIKTSAGSSDDAPSDDREDEPTRAGA